MFGPVSCGGIATQFFPGLGETGRWVEGSGPEVVTRHGLAVVTGPGSVVVTGTGPVVVSGPGAEVVKGGVVGRGGGTLLSRAFFTEFIRGYVPCPQCLPLKSSKSRAQNIAPMRFFFFITSAILYFRLC